MSMNLTAVSTTHSIDLPYEIAHLRAAYRLLPLYASHDAFLKNLLIEGFWLHARNLIEMLLGKRNATDPLLAAGIGYSPLDVQALTDLYGKICNQITHLQDGRPTSVGKLNCRDPNVISLLEREIAHFLGQVRPEIMAGLGPEKIGLPMAPDPILTVRGPPSATNAPVFGWTGPSGPPR